MTLTEHARASLGERIGKLEEQIDLALNNCGEDEVHDFRVAVRRLSQALRVFGNLFPGKEAKRMRKALKPALDAAAHVRDLDVDSELLVRLGLRGDHPLLGRMKEDRERGALAFLGQLYLLRSQDVPRAWLARLELLRDVAEDAGGFARRTLPAMAADFFRAGRKAALHPAAAPQLHAFRLEAKRFRYTLELFTRFYGPALEKRLAQVREIQGILGRRQDCAATEALLKPAAGFDPEAQKVMRALERRARKLEEEFARYWKETFDREGEERLWVGYLSRRMPAPRGSIK
ncbi:MAG: CHAD domain-containing protein [Bryobacteraceae bacterium]|nr:CHAD domain-containing protein [Bryobacteraceae bacterium]